MKKESENGHIYCHVWTKFRTEAGKKKLRFIKYHAWK